MAIDYAIWVSNCLSQIETGVCPDELWSQSCHSHKYFRRAHVFGCPVYVLEPKLQNGKKIPKWDPHARLGMFVEFSTLHSSLVPLVLNLRAGKILPHSTPLLWMISLAVVDICDKLETFPLT